MATFGEMIMTFENETTLGAALEMLNAIQSLEKAKRMFVMAEQSDMAEDMVKVIAALDMFSRAAAKRSQEGAN
jgi:hypothetical protein